MAAAATAATAAGAAHAAARVAGASRQAWRTSAYSTPATLWAAARRYTTETPPPPPGRVADLPSAGGRGPETSLVKHLKARILVNGPLSVASFMREVLVNPLAGYYMHRDVFGTGGDFVTSPEISQVFGELLAVWAVAVLRSRPAQTPFQLVELGPGRGTLMVDMLRTMRRFPDVAAQLEGVHLVELSPTLRHVQHRAVTTGQVVREPVTDAPVDAATIQEARTPDGKPVRWHGRFKDVPAAPSIVVAHEFLDALPVHQFQLTREGWAEVLIDVDDRPDAPHHFRFALSKKASVAQQLLLPGALARLGRPPQEGDMVEASAELLEAKAEIAGRIHDHGGAALFVDYGRNGPGNNSIRAIRNHRYEPFLARPGEADLSADVDFAALQDDRVRVSGPAEQGTFLLRMGIQARMQALLRSVRTAEQARGLVASYERLVKPGDAGMGSIYKLLAYTPHDWPVPPAFQD